jgi:nicotinamidase-related amidase
MASLPVRDPVGDHLLTPKNAALLVIDYQPSQFAGVRSIDRDLLFENVVSTVKTARAFGMPIVHSTINVATGRGQSTVPELAELFEDNPPIDRTTTNAWEDADFLAAVRATGRRKLIVCALWTEICMAFPALDALREGHDVYPVVDAIGGTSREARTAPDSNASSKREALRSAGWRSRSSSSATGRARRRWLTSSRSCSPNGCYKHERGRPSP